jgi:shikimate kinase
VTRPLVVLVGPMGAGKTTVGQLVADAAGVALRDTDADIEASEGRMITEIFVDEGEPHFRALEREAVLVALAEHDGVLALGGGSVMDDDVKVALKGHRVFFLKVGMADAAKRVGLGQGRPLLLGNVRSRMKALLDERLPRYLDVADVVVETDGRTPHEVADEVLRALSAAIEPSAAVEPVETPEA